MINQGDLFNSETPSPREEVLARPKLIGGSSVEYTTPGSVMSKASGFMAAYDFTLNPYSGCTFGCAYCYAAAFARSVQKRNSWGEWVEVKENAISKLQRMRTSLEGKWIYMSSVTDPYQPIERHVELIPPLLQILAERKAYLVIQTRSPLVTRDIELFKKLAKVQVNMTVTTDSEEVRRDFEPLCPGNHKRLAALEEVAAAGISTAITLTPMLPILDPAGFAARLLATGARYFVTQPFHASKGRFSAGTRDDSRALEAKYGWSHQQYAETVRTLKETIPSLLEGQEGFEPSTYENK
jgi:DNA repair photolyase